MIGKKLSIKCVSNCQLLKAIPMTITLLPASKLHLPGQTDKLFSHLYVPQNIFLVLLLSQS